MTPDDEEIHVTDRRRFETNGSPREDASGNGEDAAPEIEVLPEVVPAVEAREWERRARDAEAKLSQVADDYRRARADLDAARERLLRDQENRVRESLGRSFERVLAAIDNLDRALAHAADDNPLAEGVRLVRKLLLDAMAAEGLERIETLGQPFDPAVAEAVAVSPARSPEEANTVIEEFRPGYRFGDRVLRHAQVRVATP